MEFPGKAKETAVINAMLHPVRGIEVVRAEVTGDNVMIVTVIHVILMTVTVALTDVLLIIDTAGTTVIPMIIGVLSRTAVMVIGMRTEAEEAELEEHQRACTAAGAGAGAGVGAGIGIE